MLRLLTVLLFVGISGFSIASYYFPTSNEVRRDDDYLEYREESEEYYRRNRRYDSQGNYESPGMYDSEGNTRPNNINRYDSQGNYKHPEGYDSYGNYRLNSMSKRNQ